MRQNAVRKGRWLHEPLTSMFRGTKRVPRLHQPAGILSGLVAGAVWLAVLSTWGEAGSEPFSVTVGVDMETGLDREPPENTGTSLGVVQNCTEAAPGETIIVDTYLDAIPSGRDLAGVDYLLRFESGDLALSSSVHDDGAVNLLASAPASEVNATVSDESAGVRVVANDVGEAERGPARGVLGRYTIEVSADATGVHDIALDQVVLLDSEGGEIALSGPPPAGQLAINPATCPGTDTPPPSPIATPTPVPEEGETPDATPASSDPTPTPRVGIDSEAGATSEMGERFLYPPLGFATQITAFFDHTHPQEGPDGWVQVYTGDGGSDETKCDSDTRAYSSERLGICLSYDGHAGYDYDLPDGTSTAVRAAADGCAVDVAWDGTLGFQIVLSHVNGYRTQYSHLNDALPHITDGECVLAGDTIGYGGNTGCECGDHLHFAVLDPSGAPTDPYGWWGSEPDPTSPASKWLWAMEQPATNRLHVPSPEDAPGPLRPGLGCAAQALPWSGLPAVITSRSTLPCNA